MVVIDYWCVDKTCVLVVVLDYWCVLLLLIVSVIGTIALWEQSGDEGAPDLVFRSLVPDRRFSSTSCWKRPDVVRCQVHVRVGVISSSSRCCMLSITSTLPRQIYVFDDWSRKAGAWVMDIHFGRRSVSDIFGKERVVGPPLFWVGVSVRLG